MEMWTPTASWKLSKLNVFQSKAAVTLFFSTAGFRSRVCFWFNSVEDFILTKSSWKATDWTLPSSSRCGLRGGYVELVNIDPTVMKYIFKLFSKDSCAPVLGQIALDLMVSPPQPGDPSYPLYEAVRQETPSPPAWYSQEGKTSIFILCSSLTHRQEKQIIKTTISQNASRAHEVMCSLPGFCSQPVQGGAFIFPQVDLPSKAIQKAKVPSSKNQVITAVRSSDH